MGTNERAMFPLMANEMAFMNSVVLGTSAKRVTPSSFSGIPEPSRTTSTTSTRISATRNTISFALPDAPREKERTSDDGVKHCAAHEHASTLRPTPVRRIMTSMPIRLLRLGRSRLLPNMRRLPLQRRRRHNRLGPQPSRTRNRFHSAREILGRHALRRDHPWHESLCGRHSGSRERGWGGRAFAGGELAGNDPLVEGGSAVGDDEGDGPRSGAFVRGLGVLPDLRGVRAEGEPEADEVGLYGRKLGGKSARRGSDARKRG